jgi:hypothetical protein
MIERAAYLDKLPPEATFTDDNGLEWKEARVASFLPVPISLVEAVFDGIVKKSVRIVCLLKDGSESEPFTLPLLNLDKTDWASINPMFLTDPDCHKAIKYLAYIIQYMLPSIPVVKEYHINHTGAHIIDDIPIYSEGNRLVRSPSSKTINVVLEPLPQRLVIDPERYSECEAVAGMIEFARLCEAGIVIFAHAISAVMRAVFIDAGVIPCAVLQVIGDSGMFKTTYTSQLTQMYNRDGEIKPATRLNATPTVIEKILHENRDSVVILDDVHPAEAKDIVRKNEATLEEITRRIGDSRGRGHMEGGHQIERKPQGNAIVTGEYAYGKGSTAARTLSVNFTQQIDHVKFHQYQNERLLVSTFYHYFITWYISHYYEIRDTLKKWLADFRKTDIGVHPRLQETLFCLRAAYKFFLRYCVEQGFKSPETAKIQRDSFDALITGLVREQQKRVEQDSDSKGNMPDYRKLIRTMFKGDSFHLAKSAKRFEDAKHDGLIHSKCLCLRGEKLVGKIRKFSPAADLDEICGALLAEKALRAGKEKRTIQIYGCGGLRFYAIPLDKIR